MPLSPPARDRVPAAPPCRAPAPPDPLRTAARRLVERWRPGPETLDDYDARQW